MKKIIITLVMILVVSGVVLSLISDGEYAAERLFYRAMKNNAKILINPDVAPPVMLSNVENDLNKILTKYPKTDIIKTAQLTLAEFYIDTKKYPKALATLDQFISKYKDNPFIASKAQFLKGLVYEKQDNRDSAVKEYDLLTDKYANTPLGVQAPMYIARYYFRKQMQPEAEAAFSRAVSYYRGIEEQNRGKPLGYAASNLLIQAYAGLRQYEEAGRVVEDTINNYPLSLAVRDQLPNIELIYVRVLNKPNKAIEVFSSVKDKVKDARLKAFLGKKIESFKTKKS